MTSQLDRMRRALETMDARDRAVFELARFEGLGYRAIAEALGMEVEEAQRRLGQAIGYLTRARLGELE